MEEGVWHFDNGHQLVQLMPLGFRGSPKLRAWLTMNLVFRLGLLRYEVSSPCYEGGNDQNDEGKLCFAFDSTLYVWFVAYSLHTSQPCYIVVFAGDREGEEGLAQSFDASSKLN